MAALNKVILAGRLVSDPEIRYDPNEQAVANFRLAVNRDTKERETISCLAFGGLAKIVGEYLKKGKLVAIEGRLQIRSWRKKSGCKDSNMEIIIENLQMLDVNSYSKQEEKQ
jgi:single-strand DNA-binding protein